MFHNFIKLAEVNIHFPFKSSASINEKELWNERNKWNTIVGSRFLFFYLETQRISLFLSWFIYSLANGLTICWPRDEPWNQRNEYIVYFVGSSFIPVEWKIWFVGLLTNSLSISWSMDEPFIVSWRNDGTDVTDVSSMDRITISIHQWFRGFFFIGRGIMKRFD